MSFFTDLVIFGKHFIPARISGDSHTCLHLGAMHPPACIWEAEENQRSLKKSLQINPHRCQETVVYVDAKAGNLLWYLQQQKGENKIHQHELWIRGKTHPNYKTTA